ncbi:MAG: hypothetical protein SPJ34_04215, partial [Candidatus Ornithospirochaeta sp.]|nr:hypothetical protein [Candidatus Ornithospirochaeta sp.]
MAEVKTVSVRIGNDDLVFETGRIAKQANGAVYARYAGSAVIATVCCGDAPSEPLDYVPVSVEYNEKYYAAGKIPGGFLKRESRPKDKEILVSRLIDRPMRPLFDKAFARRWSCSALIVMNRRLKRLAVSKSAGVRIILGWESKSRQPRMT